MKRFPPNPKIMQYLRLTVPRASLCGVPLDFRHIAIYMFTKDQKTCSHLSESLRLHHVSECKHTTDLTHQPNTQTLIMLHATICFFVSRYVVSVALVLYASSFACCVRFHYFGVVCVCVCVCVRFPIIASSV